MGEQAQEIARAPRLIISKIKHDGIDSSAIFIVLIEYSLRIGVFCDANVIYLYLII